MSQPPVTEQSRENVVFPSRRTVSQQDVLACAGLFLLILAMTAYKWHWDHWLGEMDLTSFFMPWFAQLGNRLGSCDIPARNPYIFAGAPFAGDPEAGFGYLPVMILYTLFGTITATKLLGFVLLCIAGFGMYPFARLIGMRPLAAFAATGALLTGSLAFTTTHCCTVSSMVYSFVPMILLGIEVALRTRRAFIRFAAILLGAFGVCQVLAAWTGQGAAYVAAIVGLWTVYRGMTLPALRTRPIEDRLVNLALVGSLTLAIGCFLSAAWLLPRLASNAESNLYRGNYANQIGGGYSEKHETIASSLFLILGDHLSYRRYAVFAVVPMIGIFALFSYARKGIVLFFGCIELFLILLATSFPPLMAIMRLVPMFDVLTKHAPNRSLWGFTIAASVLAGWGIQALYRSRSESERKWTPVLATLITLGLLMYAQSRAVSRFTSWVWLSVIIGGVLLWVAVSRWGTQWRWLNVPVSVLARTALVALVVSLPLVEDVSNSLAASRKTANASALAPGDLRGRDLANVMTSGSDEGGAGEFLQHQRDTLQPFRIMTYSPFTSDWYPRRRGDAGMIASLQNGRPMFLQVESTMGYGPQQSLVFQTYMTALNRRAQDYHFENLKPTGGSSPLIDLLNVRYIVVDRTLPVNSANYIKVAQGRKIVYQNRRVIVFENPHVQPRAWMVYDVRDDANGLKLLADGSIDGSSVAFIEEPPPTLSKPADGATPRVNVTSWQPDEETFAVSQSGTGFLVFSEVWSKDWKATVDGSEVKIYRTDTALMGIEMPPGEHTVKLSYAPARLTEGLAVSGVTTVGSTIGLGYLWWDDRRRSSAVRPAART